jgi:AraC family transcriptional regulator
MPQPEGLLIARKIKKAKGWWVILQPMIRSVLSILVGIAVLTSTSFAIEAAVDPAGNPMKNWKKLQRAIKYASRNRGTNVMLSDLAAETHQSQFHAHRTLRAVLGETPKHFTLRLRVDRAAAALVSSQRSILDIALIYGFESHEAFCRAFRRRFQTSPSAYRKRGLVGPDGRAHADLVDEIGPCVGLYHLDLRERHVKQSMEYSISRCELAAQPVLVVRRRVRRTEIAATIGAELPKVFLDAQRRGIAIAGYPITRYLDTSVGSVTLETGMRVTAHQNDWTVGGGEGDVLAETLPAGPAAVTIHAGPYDQLQAAYAALEEWIVTNGFRPNGAPWEAYLNDPADHPDPRDWKTEVCWPFQA